MRRSLLVLVLAVVPVAAACRGSATGETSEPVLVSAAVSLSTVLEEVGAEHTRETGQGLRFNFAASNVLARQIVEGAGVDLFISADEAQMAVVERAGLVDRNTRVVLLTNQLAVVVRPGWSGTLRTLADLAQPDVRRLAIGDPAAVPAGVYGQQALARAGVWSRVESRVVPAVSVRAALAAVDEGHADAGIVYRTDLAAARHARLAFVVGSPEAPAITYPAAVTVRAPHPAAARACLAWLHAPEAQSIFRRNGFGVPSVTTP